MTDRERLIGLIGGIHYGINTCSTIKVNFQRGFIEKIADHLLSNGVTFAENATFRLNNAEPNPAHWIISGDWGECSNCHEGEKIAVLVHKDYCPACGAIMDEESVVIHP